MKSIIRKGAVVFILSVMIFGGIANVFKELGASASSFSGDYESFTNLGDYIVKTDEPGAMPAMTKEQLKTAIDSVFTVKKEEHDNLISVVDAAIKIQNDYNVNAAFAISVAHKESNGGTLWDLIDKSTYNMYSIQGKIGGGYVDRNGVSWNKYSSYADATDKFGSLIKDNYFSKSKINVDTLGVIYCENAEEVWSPGVKDYLDKMYSAVAETMIPSSGAYSNGTYSYAGKTYTLFSQHAYAYAHVPYANGNIYDSGCGVTSVAICVSGYKKGETPETIAKKCEPKYGNTVSPRLGYGNPGGVFHKFLEEYGLTCDEHEGYDESKIVNHLKSGNPVILNYGGTLNINAGGGYDTPGHFTTLLGINGNNIFVGDPADVSGEISLKNLRSTSNLKRYFLVSPKK